jgi:hypothetical protein
MTYHFLSSLANLKNKFEFLELSIIQMFVHGKGRIFRDPVCSLLYCRSLQTPNWVTKLAVLSFLKIVLCNILQATTWNVRSVLSKGNSLSDITRIYLHNSAQSKWSISEIKLSFSSEALSFIISSKNWNLNIFMFRSEIH